MKLANLFRRHRGILAVGAVFALIYMGNGSYSPYLQLYYKEIGLSTSEIGLITAVGPLASLLFQTAWGRLADRTNRKFVLLLTLILSAASALLYLLGATAGKDCDSQDGAGNFCKKTLHRVLSFYIPIISNSSKETVTVWQSSTGMGYLICTDFNRWL